MVTPRNGESRSHHLADDDRRHLDDRHNLELWMRQVLGSIARPTCCALAATTDPDAGKSALNERARPDAAASDAGPTWVPRSTLRSKR